MLLEAPPGHSFVLGDNPILSLVPQGTPMGLDNKDLKLALPLSSNLLIMADYEKKEIRKARMKSVFVEYFNAQSVIHSSREIYYNCNQKGLARDLIQKYGEIREIYNYNDIVAPSRVRYKRCTS